MYYRFVNNVESESLFNRNNRLLLGVSGGVDSVVLAHLVNRYGNDFALAHCNFNLRGEESDEEESFVSEFANELGVKCFFSSFSTKEFSEEQGISIEMAARKLRYDWFEKAREENKFDFIVVGHHLDDVLETFFLNLSRGTGIRGLSGIKAKSGRIIRPLLFATRKEIEEYATENDLSFRFDSSNDDIVYKRNKIRHQVLPLLEELNPSFRNSLKNTIRNLNQTEEIFLSKINDVRNKIVKSEEIGITINKKEIETLIPCSLYLYELLRPFNFNHDVAEEILQSGRNSGSQFYSQTHRLIVDREKYIINPIDLQQSLLFYIEKGQESVSDPLELKISVEDYSSGYKIPHAKDVAVFDYQKVNFPIVIRKWQQGEYFRPFGMGGLKKLSDFFIDEKISIPEKEISWVMASDNKIMWVIGKRTDDRFRITKETRQILKIEIQEKDEKERTL